MSQATIKDLERLEIRVGRVVEARAFPEARKAAYVLRIDFGEKTGVLKSSAQITRRYSPEELVGRLVVAAVNLPPKQIGPVMSQCRVLGFSDADDAVVLCVPDADVPPGARLF